LSPEALGEDETWEPLWEVVIPSLTVYDSHFIFRDYDESDFAGRMKYELICSKLGKDYDVMMGNVYSNSLETRMGDDFLFWSFIKEREKTYMKYFKINSQNEPPKLADV
jgi:hypothetical protein